MSFPPPHGRQRRGNSFVLPAHPPTHQASRRTSPRWWTPLRSRVRASVCNPNAYTPATPSTLYPPTTTDIEDLIKKDKNGVVALCRCWRSKTFPLCDGTHTTFNKTCGENVGPCVIKAK